MTLALEILGLWLGVAVILGIVIAPEVARRFRQNENWIEENNWLP